MSRMLHKLISACCYLIVTCVEFTKCGEQLLPTPSEANADKIRCVEYYVIGDVQGEDFLRAVHTKAAALQITGWIKRVHNKDKPEVKLHVEGTSKNVDDILQWISQKNNHGRAIEFTGIISDKFIKRRNYKRFTILSKSNTNEHEKIISQESKTERGITKKLGITRVKQTKDSASDDDDDDDDDIIAAGGKGGGSGDDDDDYDNKNSNDDDDDDDYGDSDNDASSDEDKGSKTTTIANNMKLKKHKSTTEEHSDSNYIDSSQHEKKSKEKLIVPSQYGAKEIVYDETVTPEESVKISRKTKTSHKSTTKQQITSTNASSKLRQVTEIKTGKLPERKKSTILKEKKVTNKRTSSSRKESISATGSVSSSADSRETRGITDEKEISRAV